MTDQSSAYRFVVAAICLGSLGAGWGCGKRAVSSSGDQAAVASAPSQASPVETVKPDSMAAFPDQKPAPIESARTPLATDSRPSEPASSRPPASAVAPSASSSAAPVPADASVSTDVSVLSDIYFDFDRYTVRADAQPVLGANAALIKSVPDKSVLIEGHCDERGTQAYNLVLGEKRAKAAKRYLEDLGVPASRMTIVSYGEVRPFCHEHEERCWQKNRRAHFVLH